MNFDVTLSVWNEFHARELAAGLARGGFRTEALRSYWSPIPGVRSRVDYLSYAILRASAWAGASAPAWVECSQDRFESFARRRAGRSRVFWGWNGHHLSAFRAARAAGQRVVCDRGSTHAAWASRRLDQVHRDLGWGPTGQVLEPRQLKAIEEYGVAEAIIVPSGFVRRTFLEEGVPEEKLVVNPYGVDVEQWGKVEGGKRKAEKLVFVFTASVGPRKGVHILLRAWEKAGLKDAELWFCGGIHLPIKELHLPVSDSVRFLGYTPHEKLGEVYDRASVYVLPSFEEGMARSGLEAMAAGLPLVITEETGLTDVMNPGEHGWVVPSGEVEILADTLRQVAASRDRIPPMSRACQTQAQRYTKEAYGDRAAGWLQKFL